MNFTADWFPPLWLYLADALLLLLLAASAKPAWQALNTHKSAVGVALLAMAVLWSLRANLSDGQLAGMNYHLLGISLITLMLNAPLALWAGSVVLLCYMLLLQGAAGVSVSALNILFTVLPAVLMCQALRIVCQKKLPHNVFIYIFINGFFAAAAGMLLTGAAIVTLMQVAGVYPADVLWSSAFPVFFLITWGEAFLTGLFTAIFVALAPHLLSTFSDRQYLQTQNEIWKN